MMEVVVVGYSCMEGRKDAVCFFIMLANGKRRRMHVAEQNKMMCLCPLRMPTRPQARNGNLIYCSCFV